jgi:hypothetical protein
MLVVGAMVFGPCFFFSYLLKGQGLNALAAAVVSLLGFVIFGWAKKGREGD